MATITLETPSEAVVKAANQTLTVSDARGRQIGVRKLNALTRLRMLEAVGSNCANEAYLGYASLACHAASIDGEAVSAPVNKAQLEALVQRLDDDGLNAIAAALPGLYPDPADDAGQTLKNASGTPT